MEAIPLPERFFGGGGTSHRGFPENQAGPRDPTTGFPLGGTALLFNQTELRFPLIGENIGGVLFHDMGNVFSSMSATSPYKSASGTSKTSTTWCTRRASGCATGRPSGRSAWTSAYSINPPSFFGFNGTQQDLINAGVTPCSPPAGMPNQCTVQHVSHFQFFFSIGQTF